LHFPAVYGSGGREGREPGTRGANQSENTGKPAEFLRSSETPTAHVKLVYLHWPTAIRWSHEAGNALHNFPATESSDESIPAATAGSFHGQHCCSEFSSRRIAG
jgi:hypothetical protein